MQVAHTLGFQENVLPRTPPSLSSPSGGQAVARRREEEVTEKVPSSPLDLEGPWGSPTEHKLVIQEEMEVSSRRGGGVVPPYPAS